MNEDKHTYTQPISELLYDRIRLALPDGISLQDFAKAIAYVIEDEFEDTSGNEFIETIKKYL